MRLNGGLTTVGHSAMTLKATDVKEPTPPIGPARDVGPKGYPRLCALSLGRDPALRFSDGWSAVVRGTTSRTPTAGRNTALLSKAARTTTTMASGRFPTP